jgi:hypothetical protein
MSCTSTEVLFAVTSVAFVIVGSVATWWNSSLIKLLELRHPTTYELLGRPSPLRTAESDKQAIGMLQFIWAGEYKTLNDNLISKHAYVLRYCLIVGVPVMLVLAGCMMMVDSPRTLISFSCWR